MFFGERRRGMEYAFDYADLRKKGFQLTRSETGVGQENMTVTRAMSLVSSLVFGTAVFCWTAAGETSDPQLAERELPLEILNECAATACSSDVEYRSRWVGRTSEGDLYIVGRAGCAPGKCSYWLVEKGAVAAQALLELNGPFTLHRVAGRYPVVELRTRPDEDGTVYLRFEWNGERYARTDSRRVYEVNGVECGTREECRSAAEHALKAHQVDRALRIWQRVYGVSWI